MKLTQREKIMLLAKRNTISLETLFSKIKLSRQAGERKLLQSSFTDEQIKIMADVLNVKPKELKED